MTGRLAAKVAVVTGVGPGIGRAISVAFAREGAQVVMVGLDPHAVDAVAREIHAAGGAATQLVGDVAEPQVWDRIAELAVREFGPVDVVVNSAAAQQWGTVLDLTIEDWQRTIDVNLTGALHGFRTFIPGMIERGGGSFVTISSANASIANPRMAAYATSKAGLHALSRSVAMDFGLRGIRSNCIAPGAIVTPEAEAAMDDLERETARDNYLVGRLGAPADVAQAAVYLASDEATFVTGVVLPVDGGLTIVTPEAAVRASFRARWRPGVVHIDED